VVLHGLGGDRSQPLELLAPEAVDGHRVVAPDLRAHGATTLDESRARLTFAQLAEDVEDLLAALGLGSEAALIGVSLGAAVATEILARQRISVRGALLIRPAWAWHGSPPNLAAYPLMARLLAEQEPAEARESLRRSEPFAAVAATSIAAANALLGQLDAPLARQRAQRLQALPADAPRRPPRSADAPVTVVAGDLDPVHPVPLAQQVAADLGAGLVRVPPRYDAPEEHAAAVRSVVTAFAQETRA
jgi:pimeloyl-ACP methyl ester carboxylesterase